MDAATATRTTRVGTPAAASNWAGAALETTMREIVISAMALTPCTTLIAKVAVGTQGEVHAEIPGAADVMITSGIVTPVTVLILVSTFTVASAATIPREGHVGTPGAVEMVSQSSPK